MLATLRRHAAALSLCFLAACAAKPSAQAPTPGRWAGAPVARGERFAVATENASATHAAVEVLEQGGNAADAAVVAALVLGIAVPVSSGVGGGGFAMVYRASDKKVTVLDFRESAPAAFDPSQMAGAPGARVGVPGEIAGLYELHKRFGKKPIAGLVSAAADVADKGFPVSPHMARALVRMGKMVSSSSAMKAVFFNDAGPLSAGTTARAPLLAKTLRAVAARGPSAFYEGEVARDIAETAQRGGGKLTVDDLKAYQVEERTPLKGVFGPYEVLSMPAPSAGGLTVLETLGTFSPDEASRLKLDGAEGVHALAEVFRGVYADRFRGVGDPKQAAIDLERFLKPERLAARKAGYDPRKTRSVSGFITADKGTSHLVVIDAERNVVSLTTTVNGPFGSSLVAEGAGVLLNDEMTDFTPREIAAKFGVESAPGVGAPRARPPSSMSPTIVLRDGAPVLSAGGSGGLRIATGVSQVVLQMLAQGVGPEDVLRRPRMHVMPDGAIVLEKGALGEGEKADLVARGEVVKEEENLSAVQLVRVSREGERVFFEPASDSRKFGLAEAR